MEGQDPNVILDLPPEAGLYDCRIGGHSHAKGKLKLGILKHKNGNILKPYLDDDIRSAQELSFYEKVFKCPDNDPLLRELHSFIPNFYGTWDCTINGTPVKYLCTEDVCGRFQNPSVFNVKIGPIVWEPTASKEKIERESKKYPSVDKIGFRIQGMKVYDYKIQTYCSKDKLFGKSLTTYEEVHAGIGAFFNKQFGQINHLILSGFLHQLLKLRQWFLKQRKLMFISSSLLLVYEGDLELWMTWLSELGLHIADPKKCQNSEESSSEQLKVLHNQDCNLVFQCVEDAQTICSECKLSKFLCSETQNNKCLYRISAIDFAHVLPTTEEDSNYLFGLDKFISHVRLLIDLNV